MGGRNTPFLSVVLHCTVSNSLNLGTVDVSEQLETKQKYWKLRAHTCPRPPDWNPQAPQDTCCTPSETA